MTVSEPTETSDPETPYGALPIMGLTALKAFRRVVANKDDTKSVFEVIRALSGRSIPKSYFRLVSTSAGGFEAFRGRELSELFEDQTWLAQFPPGSVGAVYRSFLAGRGYSAYGLANESRKDGDERIDDPHPIAWYARRLRDIHDVWHVLTGYSTDALGEACLLGFTYAQVGNGALLFLALAAALELKRLNWRGAYVRAVAQGWDHGRSACRLDTIDYRTLFAEPLDSARSRLGICRPTFYQAVSPAARNGYRYPPDRGLPEVWLVS
jgi:ubiquinone biosynthesis protein COQ4